MRIRSPDGRARESGIVLISSLLLLLVITILALAMFRGMGLSEKIAGNVREKQRSLHAAVVAEQYAEWLISSGNIPMTTNTCSASGNVNNTAYSSVLVCINVINPNLTALPSGQGQPQNLPWTDGAGNALGYTYTLPNTSAMTISTAGGTNTYVKAPAFYISYIGGAPDGGGTVYRIDAVGYGGNPLALSVVESTYELGSSVNARDTP
jgi:type IV pilus assembly protein PilX